ncbi:hypothetical protein K431DRAFT_344820 [Polychaeton citri CBS 116435]|uniref:t-SNARE coiled-coil homology domain-containing protein n=1 Tax=Polychaeton citri CBS 116435 TaxID=1314669 RepID=A0A9P4URZ0_9PEZI|nr:hypothetical protein K431DRAFT_344820 [Polychaeton citri CBS 116435]
MPFGFNKKEKDADLDSQKSSLFSRASKSKTSSPAPSSSNPYAVPPPANNPYAAKPSANPYASQTLNDPYAPSGQSSSDANGPPPSYRSSSPQAPAEKSPVPAGGYGGGAARFPSQGNFGDNGSGGYGNDPYGSGQSRYGPGGYGGLGRSNSQDTMATDAGRNALFGDAAKRAAQQPPPESQPAPGSAGDQTYGGSGTGGYDSTEMPGGYGGYGSERQLTAEEQEEEDVQAAKQEIRFIKQQDVASTRNARRIAEQTEITGRETLARLGAQGERIHNTERNLDMASNQNRLADEKARELKTLNRSMFAVHVANPFTAKKREEAANAIALDKHQRERAQRDATASAAYSSKARHHAQQRDLNGNVIRQANAKSLADRAKYQFEADSEDDEMENEIDENLDAIHRGVKTLNMVGKAMGEEIESQNRHIDRISNKTDKVDDEIAVNRAKLDRISRRG